MFREEIVKVSNIIVYFVLQISLLILHSFFDNTANQYDNDNEKYYPYTYQYGYEELSCSFDVIYKYLNSKLIRSIKLYSHDEITIWSIG